MFNQFVWNNYKESNEGKIAIENFYNLTNIQKLIPDNYFLTADEVLIVADDFLNFSNFTSKNSTITTKEQAQNLFLEFYHNGITIEYDDGIDELNEDDTWYIDYIIPISLWLYQVNPNFFKPYFFVHKFKELTKITDAFGIHFPEIPKKSDKKSRFFYYWDICQAFYEFEKEHRLSPNELCAFLYDFCPKFFSDTNKCDYLPKPTQIWLVGANKIDFEFLDNFDNSNPRFWQGNLETRKGDIIIMYCLSPRSHIHSVWRATTDGIADPFFHYYSEIYINHGLKISPISLNALKLDDHFSQNKLVRKNFQGVNGFSWSYADYEKLLELISNNNDNINNLPKIAFYENELDNEIKNERDVELFLLEPFLKQIGFNDNDWTRQLTVKMGRGEKVYPDYVFLSNNEKNFEQASMIIEAKFLIKNNKELELAFRQVWSYGMRLSAKLLIIVDKNFIWIYQKQNTGFDRTIYQKYAWQELKNPDTFNSIKTIFLKLKGKK